MLEDMFLEMTEKEQDDFTLKALSMAPSDSRDALVDHLKALYSESLWNKLFSVKENKLRKIKSKSYSENQFLEALSQIVR